MSFQKEAQGTSVYHKVLIDKLGRGRGMFPGKVSLGSPFPVHFMLDLVKALRNAGIRKPVLTLFRLHSSL